jgi:hypothetical protein
MSVTKRIGTGDYNLTTVTPGANVIITTDTLKIYGNLYVQGNTSVVNVANISTADPTITLNSNVTTPFAGNSGIEVFRGPSYAMPAVLWNESQSTWQITSNVANPSSYSNIQSGGGGTVVYGAAGQLTYYAVSGTTLANTTSNLTWNGANLLNITGNVETSGLRLDNINVTPPPAIATIINIIGNTSGNSAGGTGIYFNNNTESDELTSKTKAIAYSIIFG